MQNYLRFDLEILVDMLEYRLSTIDSNSLPIRILTGSSTVLLSGIRNPTKLLRTYILTRTYFYTGFRQEKIPNFSENLD